MEHPRLILRNFLSPEICKEMEFIHKSCSTVGYRPNVFSTTLSHLIAANSAHLILPIIPIRERLKEKVEEYFGCEYELFVEFTGLISWCRGASIGWHSDDNRDYLKQRDFAAVCYLNSYEVDFNGGLFHFKDGEPLTIAPMAGDVIIYTADDRNIHSVSEILKGERSTLTLWFTRNSSHDEDAKLLTSLSNYSLNTPIHSMESFFPVLASNNMYWFPPEEASKFESGFDICSARLHVLGFNILPSGEEFQLSTQQNSSNFLTLLEEPLYLARGDELLEREFVNVLHALQVVQFYQWKTDDLKKASIDIVPLSESKRKKMNCMKVLLVKDLRLAESIFGDISGKCSKMTFDEFRFSDVVYEWEAYSFRLLEEMVMSLPHWRTHQSIFSVNNLV
ncbi:hypothetical protein ABFS83_12G058700 [Erythranthe nasuta]